VATPTAPARVNAEMTAVESASSDTPLPVTTAESMTARTVLSISFTATEAPTDAADPLPIAAATANPPASVTTTEASWADRVTGPPAVTFEPGRMTASVVTPISAATPAPAPANDTPAPFESP